MSNTSLTKELALIKLLPNYDKEMQLLTVYGKLTKKDGWWNVAEHCQEQLLVADALTDLLGLQKLTKQKIMQAALCHDWDKRIEIKPEDFNEKEVSKAKDMLQAIAPSKPMIFATKPDFIVRLFAKQKSTFSQRLMHFIDSSTENSDFIDYETRLSNARRINPLRDKDPDLTKKLRGKYWERELELAQSTEKEIIGKLSVNGINLESGKELPKLIYDYLSNKYVTANHQK